MPVDRRRVAAEPIALGGDDEERVVDVRCAVVAVVNPLRDLVLRRGRGCSDA